MVYLLEKARLWNHGPLPFRPLALKEEVPGLHPTTEGMHNLMKNAGTGWPEPGVWKEWSMTQQQQAKKNSWLFQLLAEHQNTLVKQITTSQAQANHQLWEQVTKTLAPCNVENPVVTGGNH